MPAERLHPSRPAPPSPRVAGSPDAVVRLDGVVRARGGRAVLDRVGLTVGAGEVVAVVGPSGCGKSTLLELVCGLMTPDAGTVIAPPAALMAQRDLLLPWRTAAGNVALALRAAGHGRAGARRGARALLRELGLSEHADQRPDALSGGTAKRVAFLRTLAAERPVLCLDEPFAALDAITRDAVRGWLQDALQRRPRTVLLVTHDVEEAVLLADRVVVLTPRPARVRAVVDVPLPRPRRAEDAAVAAGRAHVRAVLGDAAAGSPR